MELLRVKGVLAIKGKANRVVLQAVRELYDKVWLLVGWFAYMCTCCLPADDDDSVGGWREQDQQAGVYWYGLCRAELSCAELC